MPSIEQFRNIVANINRTYSFVGLSEKEEAIYDHTLPKPILKFVGTVKLHGTCSSVCFNNEGGFWAQSKENIITIQNDNAAFCFYAESNKETFLGLINQVKEKENIDLNTNTISIFGEWAGKSIQKGVGITNLEKSFFIFGVKISPIVDVTDAEAVKKNPAYWVDCTYLRCPEKRIYNVNDYKTWKIEIDFNMPQLKQNELAEITAGVETECPIAKEFGFSGIGEGVVYTANYKETTYRFKVKGERHSISRVKTLASVDVEKLNSIKEFIDYAVTENRFNQAMEKTFLNGEPADIKKLGDLIRWVISDVIKEEMDTMAKNKIEPKEINKYISAKVREMFFKIPV